MDKLVPDGTMGGRFDYSCNDVVVGTVILLKQEETRVMGIWSLEIYPEYRRLGHGRALMQRMYALARHHGCNRMWLRVNKTNTQALALYQAEGFVVVNERTEDYEMERPC